MLLPALTAAGVVIGGVVAASAGTARPSGGDGDSSAGAAGRGRSSARSPRRALGVNVIALIAIVGALALGEELTAAVIALMSGGNALERYAAHRSRRELTALLTRAPASPA